MNRFFSANEAHRQGKVAASGSLSPNKLAADSALCNNWLTDSSRSRSLFVT